MYALALKILDTAVEITIRDSGPGISLKERVHVLERFVCLENSRNTTGNGLGLCLVQATCVLHHADLILEDANPGLLVKIKYNTEDCQFDNFSVACRKNPAA